MADNGQDDFQAIARRYWAAWGEGLRAAAGGEQGAGAQGGPATGGPFGAMPGMFGGVPGFGAAPGVFGGAPVGFGALPGMFGALPGMSGAAPGMFGQAPGMFGQVPGMFGQSPGMFGQAPGMFGAMPGLFAGPTAGFGAHGPASDPGTQAWRDGMAWWAQAAHGGRGAAGVEGAAGDAVGRLTGQAQDWFARMQQVAAQFAGTDAGAADIAQAWKQALGGAGHNPLAGMLDMAQGGQGLDAWMKSAQPFLAGVRDEAGSWLAVPGFGVGREHQERLQRLLQAQLDYQQHAGAFNALLQASSQQAYAIFEAKLAQREEPGLQLQSTRALFDLWIDAAEEAYAATALAPEFREGYGAMVNAQMRLRGAVQGEIEQATGQLGMPTRSELDGAHRKIAVLERTLRRLRDGRPMVDATGPTSRGQEGKANAALRPEDPRETTGHPAVPREASAPGKATRKVRVRKAVASAGPRKGAVAPPVRRMASSVTATPRGDSKADSPAPSRRRRADVFSRTIPAAPAPLAGPDGPSSKKKKGKR